MSLRTYQDPLHGGITLDSKKSEEAMVMALIDTKPFQRLRRIRQLGPAFLTFHGAESSRFTHSLGAFQVARRLLYKLEDFDKDLERYRHLLFAAALLHDIGHGPLSHSGEEIYGLNHEQWSSKLVRGNDEISQILEHHETGISEKIANLLKTGKSEKKVIKTLVSSQLDCDRIDYLLRDSYTTGTRYGLIDLDRLISAITIAPDGDLAVHPKGLMAVEHYLIVRSLMYRSVYNHRLNEVCNWLLEQIIRNARSIGKKKVWADNYMSSWLWDVANMDIETFLANDDIRTGYHLTRWSEENIYPLSHLCRRFLNRKLLKALPLDQFKNEDQLKLLSLARGLTQEIGLDPDISCGLRNNQIHGYHPYKGGLRLWDGENLQALETSSPLIQSLIKPAGISWLIYPNEIHSDLKIQFKTLSEEQKILRK